MQKCKFAALKPTLKAILVKGPIAQMVRATDS